MLDTLNDAADAAGAGWIKLHNKEHGTIDGEVLDFEIRDRRTPDGDVVLSRKTGNPRKVWTFTLKIEGDEEPKRWDANESAQRAIAKALKDCGKKAAKGDRLKVRVTADPADSYSQADYEAVWTPVAAPLGVPAATDDGDPW